MSRLKIDRAHMAVHPEGGTAVPGTPVPELEILVHFERDGTVDDFNNFLECLRGG